MNLINSRHGFYQQTISFISSFNNQASKANIYWVECPKGKIRYRVVSSLIPQYSVNFFRRERDAIAGINAGGRFLADVDNCIPQDYAYNLHIEDGNLISLPIQNRSVIVEKNGELHVCYLEAKGKILVGETEIDWIGSLANKKYPQASAIVFGLVNQRLVRVAEKNGIYKRIPDSNYSFVKKYPGKINIVFALKKNKLKVVRLTEEPVSLFEGIFVISVEEKLAGGIKKRDTIDWWEIDGRLTSSNTDSAVSLGVVLVGLEDVLEKRGMDFNYMRVLYDESGRAIYGGLHNQKARSIIIRTKDGKTIFLLVDANPNSDHMKGMTLFDLRDYVVNKWKSIDWAVVCDGGQSSKLCVVRNKRISIYGNMHYEKWVNGMRIPDGFNGRSLTSMVVAYES